jgi:ADP-ribose pyrophosphatase YjhB (NUDIX family)
MTFTNPFAKAQKMERYVSTVILSEDLQHIVTIRKNKPAHIAGKLNAVGGHIEAGEALFEAAVNKIKKETNLVVDKRHLKLIGNLSDADYTWDIAAFVATMPFDEIMKAKSVTDEPVEIWLVSKLLAEPTVDIDFMHMVYESLAMQSKLKFYDGSRGVRFI